MKDTTNIPMTNSILADTTGRLSSAVFAEMKRRILGGGHAAGDWLSVEALSQEFGVSRQPVMEAMRRLSAEWFVEIVPQVGCRVASFDERSMMDFINRFGDMEAHIASLAAERRTEDQLDRLTILTEEIVSRDLLDPENLELGRSYHRVVLEMAHSDVLALLCEQVWDFGTFAFTALAPTEVRDEIIEARRSIIERLTLAIREKDSDVANQEMAAWLTGRSTWFSNPQ